MQTAEFRYRVQNVRRERQRTMKKGCPARIVIAARRSSQELEITSNMLEHNHDTTPAIFNSSTIRNIVSPSADGCHCGQAWKDRHVYRLTSPPGLKSVDHGPAIVILWAAAVAVARINGSWSKRILYLLQNAAVKEHHPKYRLTERRRLSLRSSLEGQTRVQIDVTTWPKKRRPRTSYRHFVGSSGSGGKDQRIVV
ncbi:hypothetical protein MTO96_045159 [Rhipicephalus appendiculatus]